MNLQVLLSSAVIATLISVVGGMLTKTFIDTRLETVKSELNRQLEFVKSELDVWATFRNDTIKEMWKAHRDIVGGMTGVILQIQTSGPARVAEASSAVDDYRRLVHQYIYLLSPEDVAVCQEFLETAYAITKGTEPPNDANALKAIRGKFYGQMADFFHLGEVMPWMSDSNR